MVNQGNRSTPEGASSCVTAISDCFELLQEIIGSSEHKAARPTLVKCSLERHELQEHLSKQHTPRNPWGSGELPLFHLGEESGNASMTDPDRNHVPIRALARHLQTPRSQVQY